MVSKRDKMYFGIVALFGGLSLISVLLFYLTKDFGLLIPTLIFLIAMYITLIYGIFDRKR